MLKSDWMRHVVNQNSSSKHFVTGLKKMISK